MSLQVRRIVTEHDASGRAVIKIDEVDIRCQQPFISLSAHIQSKTNVSGFAKTHSRRGL